MADELMLEIVTPEKMIYSDAVEEVTVPGSEGEFGVLIGHAPLLSSVKAGELNFTKNNKKTYYAVNTGYAEVTSIKVTVLVDSALKADVIDIDEARKSKDAAEEKLSGMTKEDADYLKIQQELNFAEAQIKVAGKA